MEIGFFFPINGYLTSTPELSLRRVKLSCMHVIDVLDLQACNSRIMRVSWQVYICDTNCCAACKYTKVQQIV